MNDKKPPTQNIGFSKGVHPMAYKESTPENWHNRYKPVVIYIPGLKLRITLPPVR